MELPLQMLLAVILMIAGLAFGYSIADGIIGSATYRSPEAVKRGLYLSWYLRVLVVILVVATAWFMGKDSTDPINLFYLGSIVGTLGSMCLGTIMLLLSRFKDQIRTDWNIRN